LDAIGEILARLIGILLFGAPVLVWAFFSWLRNRRRRSVGRQFAPEAPAAPRRTPTPARAAQPPQPTDVNWLNRIKEGIPEEEAPAEEEPVSTFGNFQDISDGTTLGEEMSVGLVSDNGEPLVEVPQIELHGDGESLLPQAAGPRSLRSRRDTLGVVSRLAPLKRAIVYAEILGKPAALKDED
jgi:hypothetical protein